MGIVSTITMPVSLILLSTLLVTVSSAPKPVLEGTGSRIGSTNLLSFGPKTDNQLTCDICTDVITDIGNFIIDDTTEQQVVTAAKELCLILGFVFGSTVKAECDSMFENHLPGIIDVIVNDNMNPTQVCETLKLCPWDWFSNFFSLELFYVCCYL